MNKLYYGIVGLLLFTIVMLCILIVVLYSNQKKQFDASSNIDISLEVMCDDTAGNRVFWDMENRIILLARNSMPGSARSTFSRVDGIWTLRYDYTTCDAARRKGNFFLLSQRNVFYRIDIGGKINMQKIENGEFDSISEDLIHYCESDGQDLTTIKSIKNLAISD
jgi:cbb3-type cytochrome oxidase subunit 3